VDKCIDFYESALKIREFLSQSMAEDVLLLDLREANIWTDFFVIATVRSPTHAMGLASQLEDEIEKIGLSSYYKRHSKNFEGDEWKFFDLGNIVVHLMSKMARNFYDLEGLHKNAKKIEVN